MMIPDRVQIDTEFQDDGLFAVTFYFKQSDIPYYISFARDEYEEPDAVYVEADDQIHGFASARIRYETSGEAIKFDLSADDKNVFFWTSSRILDIQVSEQEFYAVTNCLERIFDIGRKSDF